MAFLFQCWFFIALVFLRFFFLLLFGVCGWCKLLIYLLCNQLRNRPWFSERDIKKSYWPHSYIYITETVSRVSMWLALLNCVTTQYEGGGAGGLQQ